MSDVLYRMSNVISNERRKYESLSHAHREREEIFIINYLFKCFTKTSLRYQFSIFNLDILPKYLYELLTFNSGH